MKAEHFIQAVQILTGHLSNEIIINKSTGHVSTTGDSANPTLHVRSCVPSVVHKLIAAGFSLGMHDGLMTVDRY